MEALAGFRAALTFDNPLGNFTGPEMQGRSTDLKQKKPPPTPCGTIRPVNLRKVWWASPSAFLRKKHRKSGVNSGQLRREPFAERSDCALLPILDAKPIRFCILRPMY